jgi:predicted Fe-Mo cluster-binding NifX family protein
MRIAIPIAEGKLALHFGHSKEFAIIDVNGDRIQSKQLLDPPPHEPGVLPKWLSEQNVDVVIAGGMGGRALNLFAQQGIKVLTGAPSLPAEEVVSQYMANTLQTSENLCDH